MSDNQLHKEHAAAVEAITDPARAAGQAGSGIQQTEDLSGSHIGNYRIEKLLGQGGMGKVYLAEHLILKKKFALKMLLPENAQKKEVIERFRQEAQTTSLINHPNIAAARGFEQDNNGNPFIVLDLVEGEPLSNVIANGPLSPQTCIELTEQVCEGLSYAHKLGIIHRDIKPNNIFISYLSDGSLKATIVDFGIARNAAHERLTVTGEVLGTLSYMSPEQALGHSTSIASDVYSLGCTMFEMLTGEPPFQQAEILGQVAAHVHAAPPKITRPGCEVFNPLVHRCLAKSPEDRYQSAAGIAEDLARIKAGISPLGLGPVELKSWQLLGRRFAAWAIDTLLLAAALLAVSTVLPGGSGLQAVVFALIDQITPGALIMLTGDGSQSILAMITAVLNLTYHLTMELSPLQATLGMRLMKIRIRSVSGTPPSAGQLVTRILVRILFSWLLTATALLILVTATKGVPERSSVTILIYALTIFGSVAIFQSLGAVVMRKQGQMLHDLATRLRVS